MRRLRVAVLDLVENGPAGSIWSRLMQPNFASIMPQAVAVWCEEAGHAVTYVCFTGTEDLDRELPPDVDVLFIGAFTNAAHFAAAISTQFQKRGTVTVLGGPHARCYPEDAARYFDYVLGFTDRSTILEVLRDCAPHRPVALQLSATRQPSMLPGVRERWKFIEPTIAKTPAVKMVPMLGSLGCPYTCSFCIDAEVDYQPLSHDQIKEDLRFLLREQKRPRVGWHDPNFGVRFEETMSAIEEAVPADSIDFIAESSLSLLSEQRLQRLQRNGFKAILPGIESWFALGNKSKTGRNTGQDKMTQVSDHVNTILRYIPYVQTNFVLGLDDDMGDEPFELTKRFVDRTPGAFPAYSLFSAFGQAAPLNLELQRAGRVLAFPFHFLDNNQAMNVKPKNYGWTEFYDRVIDLRRHTFSWPAMTKRLAHNAGFLTRSLNFVRSVSSEGFGRIRYDSTVRRLLDTDASVRRFFDGETHQVPSFYQGRVMHALGGLSEWLPAGGIEHDPNAFLKAHGALTPPTAATPSIPPPRATA